MKGIPGAAEHTVPVKPIDELLARFEATKNRISTNAGPVRIGVVGAGAGGVELLLSLQHRLRQGAGQQQEILTLRRQVELLKQRQEEQSASSEQSSEAGLDERPPHY